MAAVWDKYVLGIAVVLAGALIVTNPWKWDLVQRVSGFVAITALVVFAARSIDRYKTTKEDTKTAKVPDATVAAAGVPSSATPPKSGGDTYINNGGIAGRIDKLYVYPPPERTRRATPPPEPPKPLRVELVPKAGAWPRGRDQAEAAYDADRDALVVVGGYSNGSVQTDVAEWDAGEGKWRIHQPEGDENALALLKGSERRALAYDAQRKRLSLFVKAGGPLFQHLAVLQWDRDTEKWTVKSSASEKSPNVSSFRVAYDSARDRTVLVAVGLSPHLEVWDWDDVSGTWTKKEDPYDRVPLPSPSEGPGVIAYDEDRKMIVMFGSSGGSSWETWEWTETNGWENRTPLPANLRGWPPGRGGAAVAFDKQRHGVVMVGGYAQNNALSDAWIWDGSKWSDITPPSTGSSGLRAGSLVYLGKGKRLALFGGQDGARSLATSGYFSRR